MDSLVSDVVAREAERAMGGGGGEEGRLEVRRGGERATGGGGSDSTEGDETA